MGKTQEIKVRLNLAIQSFLLLPTIPDLLLYSTWKYAIKWVLVNMVPLSSIWYGVIKSFEKMNIEVFFLQTYHNICFYYIFLQIYFYIFYLNFKNVRFHTSIRVTSSVSGISTKLLLFSDNRSRRRPISSRSSLMTAELSFFNKINLKIK